MSTHPSRILLVDDDVDICQNVFDILSDLGFCVDIAHNGPAALELVRSRPYDVALLDLRMPGMDGLTLYRELRRHNAATVAMLVTAFASDETTADALAAGAWRVLRKPVDLTALLDSIHEAIDQPMILVVDDDRDLCDNLWDILRARGFRVALAYDLSDAEARLHDFRHRIVLLDMKLPGGDGSHVHRRVVSINPTAHTILITGARHELESEIRDLIDAGVNAVYDKPLDLSILLDQLGKLVDQSTTALPQKRENAF